MRPWWTHDAAGRAARRGGVKFFLRCRAPGIWYVAAESPIYEAGVRFFWFSSFDEAWEWIFGRPVWVSLWSGL